MGDQKMKCNQSEVSVLSIDAVLHVSSLLELYYFVVCLLLKDLKSIDKDGYKIAKRDNSLKCFACELESIPSPIVEVNLIPLKQSRPNLNRKLSPHCDQRSPKRHDAAIISSPDSVIASISSTKSTIADETFTIHSSSGHSVSRKEVVLPLPSPNMDFPYIQQE
ncbi:hypothetical protein DAPPUDRAFT_314864 [Daphnia pulex]|uniref:Uncharacterized protein n=1 Tax=Daphnia pulex TaxID=6669 RepID=E9G7S1_DAPPU|nr:hypothetical protein DAPPUDRAFT_314864 [Daphnia pulex]|eukprot:EFX84609.1 hypothetical protein DAPPUDRAFT_314864 [Daphnia pulex]